MGIYKKLIDIWREMPDKISKDGMNAYQRYSYVTESRIKEVLQPLLKKHGILFLINVENQETIQLDKQILTLIRVKYQFIDAETGEKIEGTFCSQGADIGDKGIFKAVTGAVKYILMNIFLVASGDDPENEERPETKKQPSQKSYYQNNQQTYGKPQPSTEKTVQSTTVQKPLTETTHSTTTQYMPNGSLSNDNDLEKLKQEAKLLYNSLSDDMKKKFNRHLQENNIHPQTAEDYKSIIKFLQDIQS